MISGIVPHPTAPLDGRPSLGQKPLSSFLVLVYTPPDTSFMDEATTDRTQQARKAADRPELRIISRSGEELSSDVLGLSGYQTYGCNDYVLAEVPSENEFSNSDPATRCYVVLSPKSLVLVRLRDKKDHVTWLVERQRYEEALEVLETMTGEDVDAREIGQRYVEHLVEEGRWYIHHNLIDG